MKKLSQKQIDSLLSDLFSLMPELKKNETEWREFIVKFVESRPNDAIDEHFREALLAEIRDRMRTRETGTVKSPHQSGWKALWWFVGGTAFAALAILPILKPWEGRMVFGPQTGKTAEQPKQFSAEGRDMFMLQEETGSPVENEEATVVNIEDSEDNAFGMLEKPEGAAASRMIEGRGGGGGGYGIMPPMPGPGRTNIDYIFEGTLPEIPEKVGVFQKKQDVDISLPLENQIKNLTIGPVSLRTLKNLEIQHLSLKENVEKLGFMVNLDLNRGTISIDANHQQWFPPCYGTQCAEVHKPLPMSDMPEDKTLIRWAEDFLREYSVSTEMFGDPIVQKYWERNPDQYIPEYAPDIMTIIYPYEIEGKTPMTQWGEPVGLQVRVSLKKERGAGLYFSPLDLTRSHYPALEEESILSMAREGGSDGVRYTNPQRTVEVTLGKPELQLTQVLLWDENGQEQTEYFVPAFVFPVEKTEAEGQDFYTPNQIVVPLAKDLFAE